MKCHIARFGVILALSFMWVQTSFAQQDSLSVTVTPPLIQLAIGPGEEWRSTLKIVNNNPYEVTYYASPVDFEAEGEEGQGKFIPLIREEGEKPHTLGGWITITNDPIVVPRGSSVEVPYVVGIPENAIPGGHYAAILVGTRPQEDALQGPTVRISSYVSSLLFVRIKGDIVEKGRIREFTSEQIRYDTPDARFFLRFENMGNTHLRPQGDVVIYNFWGKERGRVALNQKNNFGNVLPQSTRSFQFSWTGEASVFDIGRYSAVATLSYGDGDRQTATASTYFWVVPTVPVVGTIFSVVFFVIAIAWLIRRYIRKAIALEKVRLTGFEADPYPPIPLRALVAPITEGVVDLRSVTQVRSVAVDPSLSMQRLEHAAPVTNNRLSVFDFLQKYALFFFFVALAFVGIMALRLFFSDVLVPERAYEITDIHSAEEVDTTVQNETR